MDSTDRSGSDVYTPYRIRGYHYDVISSRDSTHVVTSNRHMGLVRKRHTTSTCCVIKCTFVVDVKGFRLVHVGMLTKIEVQVLGNKVLGIYAYNGLMLTRVDVSFVVLLFYFCLPFVNR